MRPAAVGFAAGSDVQAIGDGDFLFSEGAESPTIYVNAEVGDTICVVLVPAVGVDDASVFNAAVEDGSLSVTSAKGVNSFANCEFVKVDEGLFSIYFDEFQRWLEDRANGSAAIAVSVNDVFCGRILAFDSSHTVEGAKVIPLPVVLNGTYTVTDGNISRSSSYVHCEESTQQNPLAWYDYPGSNPNNTLKAAHIEIFMFNAETSMLAISSHGGPEVYINKRRYGLVVDVEPVGDVPFAFSYSKLFGADTAWWCQLAEI